MDTMSKAQRRACMSHVRTRGTKPELLVRKAVRAMGFRPVANMEKLPGTPDVALPKWERVIFVNGCFWHGHHCAKGSLPKTNTNFWAAKISQNKKRDRANIRVLKRMGWKVLTLWECEIANPKSLRRRLLKFLPQRSKCRL